MTVGCYQPGPAKNVVNGKPVTAHIYEYTTQMRVNSKLQIVPGNADSVPVQLLLYVSALLALLLSTSRTTSKQKR